MLLNMELHSGTIKGSAAFLRHHFLIFSSFDFLLALSVFFMEIPLL